MRAVDQELPAGHPFEERILLGAKPDKPVQSRIVPGPMAQHPHLALTGPELAGRQLQQRALPRPVGTEQARHARGQAGATGCSRRSPGRTTSRPIGTQTGAARSYLFDQCFATMLSSWDARFQASKRGGDQSNEHRWHNARKRIVEVSVVCAFWHLQLASAFRLFISVGPASGHG